MLWMLACFTELQVLSVKDENNFSFSSTLEAESTPIKAESQITLDWSDLTYNLMGLSIDPQKDIFKISILLFPLLDESSVLAGISNESLKQSDLSGYVEYFPQQGENSVALTEFSLQGTQLDPQEHLQAQAGTFLLIASTQEEESIMLALFATETDESNQNLSLHNDSANLDYTVDLQSLQNIEIAPAQQYVIDWQQLTQSGTQTPIQGGQIDSFMLAGFDLSKTEIEEEFLKLPALASRLFETTLSYETAVDLSLLEDQDGATFTSFQEYPIWLVALRCSRCVNPAPLFVGVIEP